MGLCSSCFKGSEEETSFQPSIEVRRRLQQEAAEKRQVENERRGIKDPGKLRLQQLKAAEMEKREIEASKQGGGSTLRWQTD